MIRTARLLAGRPRPARGFTLIELMITLVVLAIVVLALTTILLTAQRGKQQGSNGVESSQASRIALDMIARDLRCAGYGADRDDPNDEQPAIAYIDSLQVLINEDLTPFPDTSLAIKGSPLSYEPNGSPKPFPLAGTTWTPPRRYTTGAEIVRWTLDVNNDGTVDVNDLQVANGADARRTRNPDDYELVRQVYGDSTNLVAGNNGGNTERVALVLCPGGSVPPMFQVYLAGRTTPWDWSNGPLPQAELKNIARVTVQVTATSSKPDWLGHYSRTTYRTDVSSMRNTPVFGLTEYSVSGFVFNDSIANGVRDFGEPGIAGAQVILGQISTITGSNGYYVLQAPAGTYTLKHIPPPGYASAASPDTFVVTLGPATSRNFPDRALPGGSIRANVYVDANQNGVRDYGELGRKSVKLTLAPGPVTQYTDTSGNARFFAPPGSWSVTCTPPDSYAVSTPNPVTGTMVNGDSAAISFGIYPAPVGSVTGMVWRDANNDGNKQGTEGGVQNVWVGVTDDGGNHILGFAYTDANGNYTITNVTINDPPKSTPYSIFIIPPAGFYPTTPTSINNVWLQSGQTLSGENFGLNSFTRIRLDATRVLCLGSRDLVEKDWNGGKTDSRHQDQDLVLGADAGGTDQISVWFNQYPTATNSALFNPTPDYTRTAPNAVLSLALDTLETATLLRRPDLVTGTKYTTSGNFFVWLMQNSSGNEGFFPTSYTSGMNYRTADNGDVTAVRTLDCAGGAGPDMPDIIAGTKSPTAGQGSVEIWRNDNASPVPSFTREEIYPPAGGLSAGSLGEVTSIVLVDIDHDGLKDMVVSTRRSDYSGQLLLFRNLGKALSPHFLLTSSWFFGSDIPTQVVAVDVDKDGWDDLVIGTQNSTSSGTLYYLRCSVPSSLTFQYTRSVAAPGIVTAMKAADFGGGAGLDVAVGYRSSTSSYGGGVRIYFLDTNNLPSNGTDPSAGYLTNWCPALTSNNFNYGVNPSTPSPPYLTDLAAGVKIDATTGALWVFIR